MESAPAARGRLPAWTPPVWAALQSKTNHPVSVTPHLSGNLRSQRVRLCFRHRAAAAGAQLWALLVRRRGHSGLAGARFHVRSVPEGLDGIFWKTEPRLRSAPTWNQDYRDEFSGGEIKLSAQTRRHWCWWRAGYRRRAFNSLSRGSGDTSSDPDGSPGPSEVATLVETGPTVIDSAAQRRRGSLAPVGQVGNGAVAFIVCS